jgi:S1-C subfamily serine protease
VIVDLVLIIVMIAYAVSGFRQGLVVGLLSLGGFVAGAVLAIRIVPGLADGLTPGFQRSAIIVICVLLAAWIGQVLGALLGHSVRRQMSESPAQTVDQLLGAVAGLIAVALVLWFIAGALRASPSPPVARAISESRVLAAIDRIVPSPIAALAEDLRSTVAGSAFPRVFSGVGPEQIAPIRSPDPSIASDEVVRKASGSIVKITGAAVACDRGQEGSGAVIAPQRVITNAHVVAGVREPYVQVGGVGKQLAARVVAFDPRRDLAVLAVPGLRAPALPQGQDLGRGADAIVAGFPRNGPFKASAARVRQVIQASGEDIYASPGVVREVYSLFADVQPGNSGGPLLDRNGALAGVVFAKSLDDDQTGYALTLDEAEPVIQAGSKAADSVPTGNCAAG